MGGGGGGGGGGGEGGTEALSGGTTISGRDQLSPPHNHSALPTHSHYISYQLEISSTKYAPY